MARMPYLRSAGFGETCTRRYGTPSSREAIAATGSVEGGRRTNGPATRRPGSGWRRAVPFEPPQVRDFGREGAARVVAVRLRLVVEDLDDGSREGEAPRRSASIAYSSAIRRSPSAATGEWSRSKTSRSFRRACGHDPCPVAAGIVCLEFVQGRGGVLPGVGDRDPFPGKGAWGWAHHGLTDARASRAGAAALSDLSAPGGRNSSARTPAEVRGAEGRSEFAREVYLHWSPVGKLDRGRLSSTPPAGWAFGSSDRRGSRYAPKRSAWKPGASPAPAPG